MQGSSGGKDKGKGSTLEEGPRAGMLMKILGGEVRGGKESTGGNVKRKEVHGRKG